MSNLSTIFFKKLKDMSIRLGMKAEDILLIMSMESGLNSSAGNWMASGLIGATTATLKGAGFSGDHKDFAKIDAADQLDYIEKIIKGQIGMNGGKPFKSAAHYYCCNFLPVALQRADIQAGDPDAIIAQKDTVVSHNNPKIVSPQFERKIYEQNPALDADKDGKITFGDLQTLLKKKSETKMYQDALKAYKLANSLSASDNKIEPIKSDNNVLKKQVDTNNFGDMMSKLIKDFSKAAEDVKSSKIIIHNSDHLCAIEFAKVASLGLYEEFGITSDIHSDKIHGTELVLTKQINSHQKIAIEHFMNLISKSFYRQTKRLGFEKNASKVIISGKILLPELSDLSVNAASRSFILKVAGKK